MVRHKEVITLLAEAISKDGIGNQTKTPSEPGRTVFGEELAVFTSEFYGAAQAGMRASKRFEIYRREYDDETLLRHNGKLYNIIRTDPAGKSAEKLRLTCESIG